MSDLHCPARLFLARHGQAEYESPVMVEQGGSLTTLGRRQARELGERLRTEKVAHVYSSAISRAVQTAELAAGVLGVEVTVREGLGEFAVGDARGLPAGEGIFVDEMKRWVAGDVDATYPGSESARDVTDRVRPVLEAIADQHRGETVLVVSHGGVAVALQAVLGPRPGISWDFPNAGTVELTHDADGWRVVAGPA